MIDFVGRIDGKCLKFMLRKEKKVERIAITVCSMLFGIPALICVLCGYWLIGLPFLFAIVAGVILTFSPMSEKTKDLYFISRIYYDVEEDTMIANFKNGNEEFFTLDNVSVVEDYGDWYYFVFTDYDNSTFVCQKSLAVGNTIEEFEKLFEGKIRRIYQN